jgi:hypothetical protein
MTSRRLPGPSQNWRKLWKKRGNFHVRLPSYKNQPEALRTKAGRLLILPEAVEISFDLFSVRPMFFYCVTNSLV